MKRHQHRNTPNPQVPLLVITYLGRPPELWVWDGSRRNTVHESRLELAILFFKSWSSLQRYSRRFSSTSFNASWPCKLAKTKEMANTISTCPSKRSCRYYTNLGFSQPVLSTRVTQSRRDKKKFSKSSCASAALNCISSKSAIQTRTTTMSAIFLV